MVPFESNDCLCVHVYIRVCDDVGTYVYSLAFSVACCSHVFSYYDKINESVRTQLVTPVIERWSDHFLYPSGVWILIGETFPTRTRAKQGALSTASNWLWVRIHTIHLDSQYRCLITYGPHRPPTELPPRLLHTLHRLRDPFLLRLRLRRVQPRRRDRRLGVPVRKQRTQFGERRSGASLLIYTSAPSDMPNPLITLCSNRMSTDVPRPGVQTLDVPPLGASRIRLPERRRSTAGVAT